MAKIFPKDWQRPRDDIHMISLKELQSMFQLEINKGLSTAQVKNLQERYGKNQIQFSYSRLIRSIFLGLIDYFSLILWVSLVLFVLLFQPLGGPSPDAKNLINVGLIILTFLIKSLFIALQEYKLIKLMKSLQTMNMAPVTVLRDSVWKKIPASELSVGDFIEITTNQRVPADMRLISVKHLHLDKSILTGESDPIEASDNNFENLESKVSYLEAKNMALANFLVVSGSGQGVVISVGNNSHMSELTRGRSYTRDNPISRGLDQFAYAILIISFACTSIYLITWAAWIRVNYYDSALNVWISILNIIVTGIPVGLPVSIIIGLFVILQKLRQSNIVVKNIFAITSMSGIDVVLTDKTGTLTQNSLEVAGVFYSTKEIDVDLCSQESDVFLGAEAGLRELVEMCDFCTSEDSKTSTNLMEKALLEFSEKNLPKKLIEHYKIENDIEFNSMNKFQARLIKPKDEINIPIDRVISERKSLTNLKNAYVLMIRGAPDFLIPKCKYILNAGEGQTAMSDASKTLIEAKMQQWSLMGRRLICFCKKAVSDCENSVLSKNVTTTQEFQKWVNSQLNELTFIGMIGFIDPPRPDIRDAVGKIRGIGVRVVMVTGDYSLTAASVGISVGMLTDMKYETLAKFRENMLDFKPTKRSILLNGPEIDRLSKNEWKIICNEYSEIILSRATPNHKLICVKEFQANGHSVLMIGDGVNDVPALKRSDLSVAMGSGSKIAADLSSVVLLDNLFSSIYTLIVTGRQAFINIRKIFIFSMISSGFSQYTATLLTSTWGIPQLYSNLQMTLVSALTDVLPSIALFFEKPEPNELNRVRENLINVRLLVFGLGFLGPLTTILAYMNFFLFFKYKYGINPVDLGAKFFITDDVSNIIMAGQTVGFYSIVIMQTFGNLYSIRTRRLSIFESFPIFKKYRNLTLFFVSVLICIVATVFVAFPIPGVTVNIPIAYCGIAWGSSAFILVVNEILKVFIYRIPAIKRFLEKSL